MSSITVDFTTYTVDTTLNGPYAAGDTVTLADTSTTLDALTTTDIDGLVTNNVDIISATDAVLTWSADQFSHLIGTPLTIDPATVATLADLGSTIAALSAPQIHALATAGLDTIDATDNALALTIAQFNQIVSDGIALTPGDAVTIADAGATIAAISDFSTFAAHAVASLDASDNTLTISEAQFQALGSTTLTSADTVTISDTGNNIVGGPNYGTLAAAGIDFLNASTPINVTVNDITNLGAVVFTSGSTVTLTDTGAHIAAVANFATFGTHGVDKIDATNNTLTINATQFGELGTVALTAADTVTISDSAAHLSGLTFSALAGKNVDFLNATNAYSTLTVSNVTSLGSVHFTAASNVTLTDSAAHIQAVSDFTTFATHGVDTIKSSDNTLSLTAAEYAGLGTTHLTSADAVTLADTGADIATLTPTQLGQLAGNGIDAVDPTDNVLPISLAQFNALNAGLLTPPVVITLTDTSATIDGLSTGAIDTLATGGIEAFDATDNVLSLSLDQYEAIVADGIALTAGDDVTVSGNLDGLSTTEIASFATNHVDHLLDGDGFNEVIWNVAQWDALGTDVTIDNESHIAGLNFVFDSGANLSAITPTQIADFVTEGAQVFEGQPPGQETVTWTVAKLQVMGSAIWSSTNVIISDTAANLEAVSDYATFAAHGVTTISASDGPLGLTVAQFEGLGGVAVDSGNTVTLADTAANIGALTASEFGQLASSGVDSIDATDNVLSISLAQFNALGGVTLATADANTLADTSAMIDGLPTANIDALAAGGIDALDATDNVLSLSLDQYETIVADGIALTAGDDITVTGNFDNLSTTEIASFATNHVDHLLDGDGFNEVIWNVAQWDALGTDVTIDNESHIAGLNFVFDSGANLDAVTPTQIAAFVAAGAEVWEGNPPGSQTVTWNVAKLNAMGASAWSSTNVIISDTAADLQAVSDFSTFASHGINSISASDGSLSLTVAQFEGLGAAQVDGGNTVTLVDTGANIAALSATQIGELAGVHVDAIDTTDNTLILSVAQFNALGSVALTAGDTVTIADTGTNLSTLDFAALANVDALNATDNALIVTVAEFSQIVTDGITLAAGDTVTISDTAANLAALTFSALASARVDFIDATDAYTTLTVAQMTALGGVAFTPASAVTLTDTAAHIEAVSDFSTFAAHGVDTIDSTDNTLSVTIDQLAALGATQLASADVVTLADSGTDIAALTSVQFGGLATLGVDTIDATDNALTISLAQFDALGATTLTPADTVTLADTGAAIGGLSPVQIAALATAGVDALDASDNALTLSVAQFDAIITGGITLAAGDAVTISDTAANLAGLTFSVLAGAHVDALDATDAYATLTVAQMTALGSVAFTPASAITLTDSAAHIDAVSDFSIFAAHGVDSIDSSDNTLTIDVAQFSGLGATALTGADFVTVADTAADISTAFDALNGATGVDRIIVTDSAGHKVGITEAQVGDTRALGELYEADGTTPAGVDVLDAPVPTTVVSTLAFSADTGASSSDFITNVAAQTISGTLSANLGIGETVEVSLDAGATWTTAAATVGIDTFALAGQTLIGSGVLEARVSSHGGSSTPDSHAYVLDTAAPDQPAAPALEAGSDSGTLGDGLTSNADPAIAGSAEDGATVTLYDTDGSTVLGTAIASGGTYTITSSTLADGHHTLSVTATDAAGNVSAASAGLAVAIDTIAPVAHDGAASGIGDSPISGTLSADDANSTTLTYSLITAAAHGSVDVHANGTFVYTPDTDYHGIDSFTFRASDGASYSDAATESLTINALDRAPTDIALSHAAVDENSPDGTVVGSLSDTDPDTGDSATFSLLDDAGGRFAIDGGHLVVADGTLLDFELSASHSVTVEVTDSAGLTFEKAFDIAINDVNPETIGGTPADDTIFGGALNDNVNGGPGDDVILGGAGDDALGGGTGNDSIVGGDGNDTIWGEDGSDNLGGSAGNDLILGGDGNDDIGGDDGNDVLVGGDGNDALFGGAGDDLLGGGTGDDKIIGGDGNDTIWGEDGNDTINAGAGDDIVLGGAGNDQIGGGADNDTLLGGDGNDTMWGEDGDDVLIGGPGDDVMIGGAGHDTFSFFPGDGHDTIVDFTTAPGPDSDHIWLSGTDLHSFADAVAHESFNSATGATTITYNGTNTITLNGVAPAQLTADHFIFS